jgi:hypothetical protein
MGGLREGRSGRARVGQVGKGRTEMRGARETLREGITDGKTPKEGRANLGEDVWEREESGEC